MIILLVINIIKPYLIVIIMILKIIMVIMIFIIMIIRSDPLVRQQVEWSVRQETGYKRRAFLVANRFFVLSLSDDDDDQ